MPRWFQFNLDEHQSILLKKAIAAMAQVASSYPELAGRPLTADLFVKPNHLALVSRTIDGVSATLIDLSLQCNQSRKLQISLANLNRELEKNTGAAVTLYGNQEDQDLIRYELQKDSVRTYTSIIPLLAWNRDQMNLELLVNTYPVHIRLSSTRFVDLITEMDDFGCTVHVTLSKDLVVFRVVNHEVLCPTEPGICEIVSGHGFPHVVKFSIQHMSALLNAAVLSEMISICFSDSYAMIAFHIPGLGNLVFGHHNCLPVS